MEVCGVKRLETLVTLFSSTGEIVSNSHRIFIKPPNKLRTPLEKGSTSVALYGLGNIRDERLNRMFQTPHAVQWMRPEAQESCQVSDWFNILVLHKKRVKTNPKKAINEHFLPRFLDFIVWGHDMNVLLILRWI
ncbi:hypothetical protein L1887_14589 [Cichorium endivia]|nr:hypothetical protein L1887_14589 [Cichorium endivia]